MNEHKHKTSKLENAHWRHRLYEIIFEAETPEGRAFDIALLWAIVISVIAVMMESVQHLYARYGTLLRIVEWIFTIIFTLEYIARIIAVRNPKQYIFSFLGIIDLLALLPSYLSLIFLGSQYFLAIRTIRLLRVFRIFKLTRYLGEAEVLAKALRASTYKITVFLGVVISIVIISGTLMYIIEGEKSGFTSIPTSIYWAIVTLTTVGYGDIAPQTTLGQTLASFIMIVGYGIIAVPTGIVTSEITRASHMKASTNVCPNCLTQDHESDAIFCKHCGTKL
jgi:voltage-gated potassium channel